MAKKDTYLALLRRGIDETTAQQLADSGLKIGDLKKIDKDMLIENYGLKSDIADGVISIITAGPQSHGKERYLSKVLAPEKKQESKIEEIKFQRKQKDVLTELAEQKERLKIAKVESFRAKKLIMNRLGKTVELIVKLENNLHDEGKDDQKVKIRDQLETRGLEAARDHEMLELEGTPQDIVDFRRKHVPALIFHACPHCGDEMDPRQARDQDRPEEWAFMCWPTLLLRHVAAVVRACEWRAARRRPSLWRAGWLSLSSSSDGLASLLSGFSSAGRAADALRALPRSFLDATWP